MSLVLSQNDTIVLKDVQVSDKYLKKNTSSQNLIKLNDSILDNNKPSLTNLLNNNSSIYFKQNGYGMVSSPSFRGTTAQQTAVVWNGININSQLTGQTDFNTISTRNFDNVVLKAGGGSTIYGTSAIGGTVHLNNELIFKNILVLNFNKILEVFQPIIRMLMLKLELQNWFFILVFLEIVPKTILNIQMYLIGKEINEKFEWCLRKL